MSIEGPTPATSVPALAPASAASVSTKDLPPRYSLSSEPRLAKRGGKDHYWYLGWPVSTKWLTARTFPDRVNSRSSMHKVVGAMRRLRLVVKYQHIRLILVQPDGLDTPPTQMPCDENHRDAVSLVAIRCNKNAYFMRRRPNSEQMQKRIEIFGGEPRWAQDIYPREDFEVYGFDMDYGLH
ncbi:hypothetical protein B0H10DRAFT_2210044 [Mycena sp. CBHHK59/15]|nr:hypothetical protein B0H10DRAFT_2210044 [Mycena sp. CBHHK59/15]